MLSPRTKKVERAERKALEAQHREESPRTPGGEPRLSVRETLAQKADRSLPEESSARQKQGPGFQALEGHEGDIDRGSVIPPHPCLSFRIGFADVCPVVELPVSSERRLDDETGCGPRRIGRACVLPRLVSHG